MRVLPTAMRMPVTVAAVLVLIAGCGGSNSLNPFQPEINNAPGNFQLQVTGMKHVSTTVHYLWQNSKTTANVNQACALSGGTATLVILDNGGTQVYSGNLATNGTFVTAVGVAGSWTIRLVLSDASGTVNLRVQTP